MTAGQGKREFVEKRIEQSIETQLDGQYGGRTGKREEDSQIPQNTKLRRRWIHRTLGKAGLAQLNYFLPNFYIL